MADDLIVTFVCRRCGKVEYVVVWSPLLLDEVCSRTHSKSDPGARSARDFPGST